MIIYVPINEYKANSKMLPAVGAADKKSIRADMIKEMGESQSVHSKANHKGVAGLIEAVSMYFWTKNMVAGNAI